MKRLGTAIVYLILVTVSVGFAGFPASAQLPSEDQRIAALATIWSEVKFAFPSWDLVPELDWDQTFLAYIPKVKAAQDEYSYYRTLQRFMCLLQDGHSNVSYPATYWDAVDYPLVGFDYVAGKVVVSKVLPTPEMRQTGLERGDVVVSVDGIDIERFLESEILPYVNASTDHSRMKAGVRELLFGPKYSKVTIGVAAGDGQERQVELIRSSDSWSSSQSRPILEKKELVDGFFLVSVNSFGSKELLDLFDDAFPNFRGVKGMIIDLRLNGGGSGSTAYSLLSRLLPSATKTSSWKARRYIAVRRAWGYGYEWITADAERLSPASLFNQYRGPLALLIGPDTASASEDFVVAFRNAKRGPIIGTASAGTTGQPLTFSLPGGAQARVVTRRDAFPDGEEFVGVGIRPDIVIETTLAQFINGDDPALAKALEVVQKNESNR